MKRLVPIAILVCTSPLDAQGIWDSSLRLAPSYYAYDIKAPFNEKITEFSLPLFYELPVTSAFTIDIGTAVASVHFERIVPGATSPTTRTSDMSGLTDTQIRGHYSFGQDFLVVTAGVNVPTGSATLSNKELEAATRIGSNFLTFPVAGFGSGLSFTGGVAIAQPVGDWSVGFGGSMRQTSQYEPFLDSAGGKMKFTPGPEYRATIGADHPFGTGRFSLGLTYSNFGNDNAVDSRSNSATFNTGNRYIGQLSISNSLTKSVDYSFGVWDLYRTSGTLINSSISPADNVANGTMIFGVRGPGDVGIEPSIEGRVWTAPGYKASYLGSLGIRLIVNQGGWAIVPGGGFSIGTMQSAPMTGFYGALGVRFGGS